jgi:hypothetical protein
MPIYPYSGSDEPRLVAVSWAQRLAAARTESEVVAVARDFLATFSPYDLARLPEECRPGRIVDGSDVNDFALLLVRYDQDDRQGTARCIHRLTTFFTNASIRLSELLAAHADEPEMPPPPPPGRRPRIERRASPRGDMSR